MKRYKILSDNDGHDYIIAVEDEKDFYLWVDTFDLDDSDESDYNGKGFEDRMMTTYNLTFTDPKGWN